MATQKSDAPAPSEVTHPETLSSVAQDYLKVIWTVQEWSRERVSTKLLSERIGVSASTVSEAIRKLSDQGWSITPVRVDRPHGRRPLGRGVHGAPTRLIETFLVNELG